MTETKQIAFRPNPELYARLAAHKNATDAPFNRTLERALDAYLTEWEKQSKGAHVVPTGKHRRR